MQTFKCFFSILKKNIPSVLIYVGIFVTLIIILSNVNASQTDSTYKDEKIPFTVINRDESELGDTIKNYLAKKNEFVKEKDDKATLQNAMFNREIYYILIIPEGFEAAIKNGDTMKLENMKVKDSAMGYYLDMEVDSYMKMLTSYMTSGCDLDQAAGLTETTLDKSADVSIVQKQKTKSHGKYFYYYQILPYITMAILMSAVGPVFIAFNKSEVKRRISCSALTVKSQNMQFSMGTLILSMVIWIIFNVLALILYPGQMSQNEILLSVGNTFCFGTISLGLTFLAGSIAKNDAVLGGMVNVVALGTSFLGGIFVPIEVFGKSMKAVAKFMPTYWYIKAHDAIMGIGELNSESLKPIFTGYIIQLIFAAAILSIALLYTKRQRARA